jgi:predicted ArsR family transcriptional regulator
MLKADEPLTVPALAKSLGISRKAAHQHVMAMEAEGLVERASAVRTKGRPSQGFRLSPAGGATFPRQYSLLARQLLEQLSQHLGPDELLRALSTIGLSLADALRSKAGSGEDERIKAIAELMRELGYESRAVEGAAGMEIEAHNCVFHDLAMADSRICEIDLALLGSLSGKVVDHRSCMAKGERSCRFSFKDRLSDPSQG